MRTNQQHSMFKGSLINNLTSPVFGRLGPSTPKLPEYALIKTKSRKISPNSIEQDLIVWDKTDNQFKLQTAQYLKLPDGKYIEQTKAHLKPIRNLEELGPVLVNQKGKQLLFKYTGDVLDLDRKIYISSQNTQPNTAMIQLENQMNQQRAEFYQKKLDELI